MGRNKGLCIFALPSVTYALRAKELLELYNIGSRVMSLEPSLTKKGCGNGIELNKRYMSKAKSILLRESIPISEIVG